MIKKALLLFIVFWCFISILPGQTQAIKIITQEEHNRLETDITRGEALSFFASLYKDSTLPSYKYIQLEFLDVLPTSWLYEDLQVLVYFDLIKNTSSKIHPSKKIDLYTFWVLSNNILWVSISGDFSKEDLQSQLTKQRDLEKIEKIIDERYKTLETWAEIDSLWEKVKIFKDVYETLMEVHYNRANLDGEKMIYSAIEWLTEWVDDTYTTYFPPVKNQGFQESINGEYEWIGSYVEMTDPGVLLIVSPIVGSPSEKAGIKGWDQITHVDGKEITEEVWLTEAISWIKGPKWTTVTLTILRWTETLEIDVVREKIIIKDIDYSLPRYDTFYIQIKNFWPNVFDEFTSTLESLEKEKRVKRIIIDVRNNPGGYLDQVSKILWYFVPEGEATAIVDYGAREQKYMSEWLEKIDFSNYKIMLLQNGGSASASEILVGSIKDYHPESTIVWEKSFGKWSVQNIKSYADGSSLKVTVAKWFTGKSKTWIDGLWITPDIEVELDEKKFEKWVDTQLEAALNR